MTEGLRTKAVGALAEMVTEKWANELLDLLDRTPAAMAALAAWLDEWCGECGFGRKYHPRGHEWTDTGMYAATRPEAREDIHDMEPGCCAKGKDNPIHDTSGFEYIGPPQ